MRTQNSQPALSIQQKLTDACKLQSKKNSVSHLAQAISYAAVQIAKQFANENEAQNTLVDEIASLITQNQDSMAQLEDEIKTTINDFSKSHTTPKKNRIVSVTEGTSDNRDDTDSEFSFVSPSPVAEKDVWWGTSSSSSFTPVSPISRSQLRRGSGSDASYRSPSFRSRHNSSGRYPDESGSRNSEALSPLDETTSKVIFSPTSPDSLSPVQHGFEFAARTKFSPNKFAAVGKDLNQRFANLKPHRQDEAIALYIKLAKTAFGKLKASETEKNPLSDQEKEKCCRNILQWLFVAYPDIAHFDDQNKEHQEIQDILIYCYQYLFFQKSDHLKIPKTIFELFSDSQWFSRLKTGVVDNFSLLPYLGYIYLQFKNSNRELALEKYQFSLPEMIISIFRQDIEQGVNDEKEIPWRTALLESFFQLDSGLASQCLPLCIQQGNKKYVDRLLEEAKWSEDDLLAQSITVGQWRVVVRYAMAFPLNETTLAKCIELALTAHQQQEIKELDEYIDSLLKANAAHKKLNDNQQNTKQIESVDGFKLADMLIQKGKWSELVDWLRFIKIKEEGFELVNKNQVLRRYYLQAIFAGKSDAASKLAKHFQLHVDLKDLCHIPSETYSSQQWLDIFLHAIHPSKMAAVPQSALRKNSALKSTRKQQPEKRSVSERLYFNLYSLLNGLKNNSNFPVDTIQFEKDELDALKKGADQFFYEKLKETMAAPLAVRYIQQGGTREVAMKRGESKRFGLTTTNN